MKLKLLNSPFIFLSVLTLISSQLFFAGNKNRIIPSIDPRHLVGLLSEKPVPNAVRAEIFGLPEGIVSIFSFNTNTIKPFGYTIARQFVSPVIRFYDRSDKLICTEKWNPGLYSKETVCSNARTRLTGLPEAAIIAIARTKAPAWITIILFDKKKRVITQYTTERPFVFIGEVLPDHVIEKFTGLIANVEALKTMKVSKSYSLILAPKNFYY